MQKIFDPAELEALFLKAMWLVTHSRGNLRPGRKAFSDYDDLKQTAWEELWRKLPYYDPSRGKLSSFALKVMRRALIKEVISTAAMARLPASTGGRSIAETVEEFGLNGGSLEAALGEDESVYEKYVVDETVPDPGGAEPQERPRLEDYCATRRERRVLALLSGGLSYECAGKILGLTRQSIHVVVKAIRARVPADVARKLLVRER